MKRIEHERRDLIRRSSAQNENQDLKIHTATSAEKQNRHTSVLSNDLVLSVI